MFIAGTDARITKLLEAMGIVPEKTRRVVIDMGVEDIVVSVTEAYISDDDIDRLTEVVRQFKLVPKDE